MPTKEQRIKKEITRLNKMFANLDKESKASLDGLIRRAAYMRITLEDYEADLDTKGYVELFSQSEKTEPYERERPVARLYNSMNKNYQSIMKMLGDRLPESSSGSASEDILKFAFGAKK